MSQSVLDWVGDALRAERQLLDLVLQERHGCMMKALALELQGVKWKNGVPPINALGPSSPREDAPRDDGVSASNWPWLLPKPPQNCGFHDPMLPQPRPPTPIDDGSAADVCHTPSNTSEGVHDEPGQAHKANSRRERVRWLLGNSKFETFIGGVILVNSIIMGVETQFEIEGRDPSIFRAFEHFFLACYTLELCMWFFAYGHNIIFRNGWVAFDCVLVFFGILGTYVIDPIVENLNDSKDEALKNSLVGLLVMRMMRLFRLARILRVLVIFKVLWMLVRGLLHSAATIIYTMGLIMVIIYMFACMSIELITKKHQDSDDDLIRALVAQHFSDLPITMLSLLQFVTGDGITVLYFPLIQVDPMLIIFFVPFIFIVSVSLMNLVTAVIVEGAIEQGKQDREATTRYRQHAFRRMMPHLKHMFKEIDQDNDSLLTREELESAPEHVKQELNQYIQSGSLMDLFEMLDVDQSGEVDLDEFCDGIAKLVLSEAPVEVLRVLKQLQIIRTLLDDEHCE